MQIQMRYHHTPPGLAEIKASDNTEWWWGCGKPMAHAQSFWWEYQMVQPFWKTVQQGLNKKNQTHNYLPPQQLYSWKFTPEKWRLCSHKNLHKNVYSSFIHGHPKLETTQLSFNECMAKHMWSIQSMEYYTATERTNYAKCNKLEVSPRNYAEWKIPVSKGWILYGSI